MDADGQRPLSVLADFLQCWKEGYPIVYGVREEMKSGYIRRGASHLFNALMTLLSPMSFEPGVTDFMLIDKQVIPAFRAYTHKNRLFRGIMFSLDFPRKGVRFIE